MGKYTYSVIIFNVCSGCCELSASSTGSFTTEEGRVGTQGLGVDDLEKRSFSCACGEHNPSFLSCTSSVLATVPKSLPVSPINLVAKRLKKLFLFLCNMQFIANMMVVKIFVFIAKCMLAKRIFVLIIPVRWL